jgi:hypothetical protein
MAYTSIIPVHRLDSSISYIKDRDKTKKPGASAGSLEEAIGYAMNREKTESMVFETAIGCTCESAFSDMLSTKQRFHKTGGVQGYHLVQSFAEGEVTPELAHLIGTELAGQLLQGKYEAVITTHLNTSHYHNHLVFNSVSMEDGRKYHSNSRSYYEDVRRISDGLCKKYGLSLIQPGSGSARSYAEWQAEQAGKPTWRTAIRLDIKEAAAESFSWRQFLSRMEQKGYVFKLNRKYPAVKAPGMERYVRLKSLGKNYSEEAIREQILRPKADAHRQAGQKNTQPKKKLRGLQALYYSYLYQMGVLKNRPRKIPYAVRQDIRRLDERIAQMEFLQKHGITTREELAGYRKPLEEKAMALVKERHRLYRAEPGSGRISEITGALKPLRKEIRMCAKIEQHSLEMEKRLRELAQQQAGEERESARGRAGREEQQERR